MVVARSRKLNEDFGRSFRATLVTFFANKVSRASRHFFSDDEAEKERFYRLDAEIARV
jgi:hypothetical protein